MRQGQDNAQIGFPVFGAAQQALDEDIQNVKTDIPSEIVKQTFALPV